MSSHLKIFLGDPTENETLIMAKVRLWNDTNMLVDIHVQSSLYVQMK